MVRSGFSMNKDLILLNDLSVIKVGKLIKIYRMKFVQFT